MCFGEGQCAEDDSQDGRGEVFWGGAVCEKMTRKMGGEGFEVLVREEDPQCVGRPAT